MRKIGLIPAAGLATRMGIDTPKELVEFNGRPIIDYTIMNLKNIGIKDIVVVIRKDKESIQAHVNNVFSDLNFIYVYQTGKIGNLIDAIKTAYDEIKGKTVYFGFPDTIMDTNPFDTDIFTDLQLLCFRADYPQCFGTVLSDCTIEDKPKEPKTDMCWGAIIWSKNFTEIIMEHDDFTKALNTCENKMFKNNIGFYKDIGTVQ